MDASRYVELKRKKLVSLSRADTGIVITTRRFDSATGEALPSESAIVSVTELASRVGMLNKNLESAKALLRDCEKIWATRKS